MEVSERLVGGWNNLQLPTNALYIVVSEENSWRLGVLRKFSMVIINIHTNPSVYNKGLSIKTEMVTYNVLRNIVKSD